MLAAHDIPVAVRDYFREPFTVDELRALLQRLGLTPRDVLSRRARAFKELIGDREARLSDDELIALIVREPTLLRRPLMARAGRAVVGLDRAGIARLING